VAMSCWHCSIMNSTWNCKYFSMLQKDFYSKHNFKSNWPRYSMFPTVFKIFEENFTINLQIARNEICCTVKIHRVLRKFLSLLSRSVVWKFEEKLLNLSFLKSWTSNKIKITNWRRKLIVVTWFFIHAER
jgi:hypothetical protein